MDLVACGEEGDAGADRNDDPGHIHPNTLFGLATGTDLGVDQVHRDLPDFHKQIARSRRRAIDRDM
jgi:hypothetical protein